MDTNPDLEETIWEILIKFQNQNKTFGKFGFPKFFDVRTIDERKKDKGKSDYIVR